MIKVGLIGPGQWGKNYIKTIKHFPEVELVWVAKRNYKKLLNLCNTVIIATPYVTHYQIVKNCLNANKDVLVEKPITCNSNHALELHKLAKEKNKILMVGHIFLFHSAIIKIKELIDEGYLGDIKEIYSKRLSMNDKRDALWEMVSHDVYILDYLLETKPIDIKLSGPQHHRNINFIYPADIRVSIELCTLYPKKVRQITIRGTKKTLFYEDNVQNNLIKILNNKTKSILVNKDYALTNQCKHFFECVENRITPKSCGLAGYENIKSIEKILE